MLTARVKRRWLEFRWGHSIYLGFIFSFVNFLLITWRLLVEQMPFFEGLFQNLTVYALVGLAVYIPLAIGIGHFHRVKQLPTDQDLPTRQNSVIMEILERIKNIEKEFSKK